MKLDPQPFWMLEIESLIIDPSGNHSPNRNLGSTFELFWEHGYEAWAVEEVIREVAHEEVQSVVRGTSRTLSAHNFLFLPRGIKPTRDKSAKSP